MRVYAVVGGIAAGKSTVARRLARRYGGTWIDADRVGHRVLGLRRVRERLLDAFGPDIVGRAGSIDRRRLGSLVFGHPARLRRLDTIVHPEIARRLRVRLAALQRQGRAFVLLDAALFYEFDIGWPVDGVLAVVAPLAVRRARLAARPGMTAAAVASRLRSQPRLAAWIRRADVRLANDGDWHELGERIEVAWRELGRLRGRRRGRIARGAGRGS